ncbi:hypothetical protein N7489_006091 [Penicillium chrysogenum]|jgi:hypothetical protein|uniref:Uncharacterized protein n=1 Tax=Penicillium chrysogenum TaxID=5076 RepID=A0ABQ8W2H6_PENCH|nr:uncharacterized protein N7489_006091 [Penicillium chrysogenum]KAJ5236000.1 hypothetical protein N7489_006091 [Penicillium chrysogenum]KAJ5254904.1 hypothetical protein N7505_010055 [Penicillium chrysogenum]KAJ5275939.1 hypothetical protein N7524_002092 [Penicillium chrysogenum]
MQASEKLPTYEESTKSPKEILMDRLKKKIEKAQKPEDLLTHLLSTDLNVEDKATLLRQAPKHIYACYHRRSAEYVEAQLREAGYGELVLYLYWCFFWYEAQPTVPESWIKELIELDIEERWVAQRKVCIQEKLQTLQASSERHLSFEDGAKHASQLESYEEQLKDLNKRHWALSRKKWNNRTSITSWSFSRAYDIQRSYPQWYLSVDLISDCVGRGGCCGRSCGCCKNLRTVGGLDDGINTRGHCTTACGCCLKAHGIEDLDVGINEEIPDLRELCFEYRSPPLMSSHSRQLLRGYAFNI